MVGERATRRSRTIRVAGRLAALLAVAGVIYVAWLWLQVPEMTSLREGPAPASSFMRASGEPAPPTYASLDEVSPVLACAVVKAEDVRFFFHGGIDWPQLWLALRQRGSQGGASTITQQLARNLFLSAERTIHRKLREAFTAHRMERALTKRRILELYLNVIQLGPGIWGVRAASEHYFGKPAHALDAFEAIFLSALIAAPNAALAGANLERLLATARRVLTSLYRSGLIDAGDHARTEAGLSELAAALADGHDLHEALAQARRAPPSAPPKPRSQPEPLPTEDVFAQACGYEREVAEAHAALRE